MMFKNYFIFFIWIISTHNFVVGKHGKRSLIDTEVFMDENEKIGEYGEDSGIFGEAAYVDDMQADTTEPETFTTDSIDSSTATSNTISPPSTTPAVPGPGPVDPEWENSFFNIDLSVKFTSNATDFEEAERSIKAVLVTSFEGSENLGFTAIGIKSTENCSESTCEAEMSNSPYDMVTFYYAQYKVKTVLKENIEAANITTYIAEEAMGILKNSTMPEIAGSVYEDYIDNKVIKGELPTAEEELERQINNPCTINGICQLKYYCFNDKSDTPNLSCYPICYMDETHHVTCCEDEHNDEPEKCAFENEICEPTGSNVGDYLCSCDDGFMYFGDNCADKALVIGVLSGIAGFIILCLLIATIVLGAKQCKTSGNQDDKMQLSEFDSSSKSHQKSGKYKTTDHFDADGSISEHNYNQGNGNLYTNNLYYSSFEEDKVHRNVAPFSAELEHGVIGLCENIIHIIMQYLNE